MKILIPLILMLGITRSVLSQPTITKKLDELITVYTRLNKFNGSVLVARHGEVLLEKGYGFKNAENKIPNDKLTIFQIGSISKEFTASIILKLAEQKRLSLNDKLSKYFTGFPAGDSISIKNLLTHTSGIFNYTEVNNFWSLSAIPTNEQNVLDTLKKRKLLFSPGKKFSYSNSNYMLLAYIIQKITHKPYERVVRDWIFKPLNMTESGFDFTGLKNANKAKPYWRLSAAKTEDGPPNDSTEFIGSGEIYSTVGDLYKWHRALQEKKIIKKETLDQAYQPFSGKYGYGWELDTICNKPIVGHGGRMFGFEAKMIRIPGDDVFVILLNNCSDGPFLEPIAQKIIAILYQQPYFLPEQPLALDEETLKNYTGVFATDKEHSFEIRLINGHLFGIEQPGEKMMLELFPMKNNILKFIMHPGEEGEFDLTMDQKGRLVEITTINPRGIKLDLKRVN